MVDYKRSREFKLFTSAKGMEVFEEALILMTLQEPTEKSIKELTPSFSSKLTNVSLSNMKELANLLGDVKNLIKSLESE